jgi:hypothetical protein
MNVIAADGSDCKSGCSPASPPHDEWFDPKHTDVLATCSVPVLLIR